MATNIIWKHSLIRIPVYIDWNAEEVCEIAEFSRAHVQKTWLRIGGSWNARNDLFTPEVQKVVSRLLPNDHPHWPSANLVSITQTGDVYEGFYLDIECVEVDVALNGY